MKKSSERLKTVLKLAKLRETLAAEKLAETIRNVNSQQQQGQQLQGFQKEYQKQFSAVAASGVSALTLMNYQCFYGSLEQAVEVQLQRLELSGSQRDQARADWQQYYSRQKNMEKLVDRKVTEEEQELEKKIQREQDDRGPSSPGF